MWSIIFVCSLIGSSAYAITITTIHVPNTSIAVLDSKATVTAQVSAPITDNTLGDISGSIQVQQDAYTVGVSLSSDQTLSAILGYSNSYEINGLSQSPILVDVDVNTQISSLSGTGSASVSAPALYINPQASITTTVTRNGIENYALGMSVTPSSVYQASFQLSGASNEYVTLQGTTQVGPVTGVVTWNGIGTWDGKISTELTTPNELVTFNGQLHRDSSNQFEYVLQLTVGINSPIAWGKIHIDTDNSINYYAGLSAYGVLDNNDYVIEATGGYLSGQATTQYNLKATYGQITGIIAGTNSGYSLQVIGTVDTYEAALEIDYNTEFSYSLSVSLAYASVQISLDKNFSPTSLTGNFWNDLLTVTAETDFSNDYNFSLQLEDQVSIF